MFDLLAGYGNILRAQSKEPLQIQEWYSDMKLDNTLIVVLTRNRAKHRTKSVFRKGAQKKTKKTQFCISMFSHSSETESRKKKTDKMKSAENKNRETTKEVPWWGEE